MKRLPTFSRLILTACAAWCLLSANIVSAQDSLVETVSVNADDGVARIRVHRGARLRDLNRMARRHATAPGLHLTMDRLAELNPGQVISVCFDNLSGERPMMSRDPGLYETCIGYRRAHWLVAGQTYTVPLRPTAVTPSEPVSEPAAAVDDGSLAGLETQIADLEADLAEANTMLEISIQQNERLMRRIEESTSAEAPVAAVPASSGMSWEMFALFCAFLIAMIFVWFTEVRKHYKVSLDEELGAQRKASGIAIGKYKTANRKITVARDALAARLKRLQSRTHLLIAALAGFRKRAHANQKTIDSFQLRRQEDDVRRKRLPKLLNQADDTRRESDRAEQWRERIKTLEHWMETAETAGLPDVKDVYRRMIAEYKVQLIGNEEAVSKGEMSRVQLVNDLFHLTGMMSDSVEVEGRLERSIQAASLAKASADGQAEACGDVIRIHLGALRELKERELKAEERDLALLEAEKKLGDRIREHVRAVAEWQKAHEAKKDLDVFTAGLTDAKLGELDDVTRRMSELEGRVRGLDTRANTAEKDLEDTNSFLEAVRLEFRDAKALLAEFRKSPLSLEGRIVQLVDYMKDLEKQLGIQRPSLFGDLPAASYGAAGSKKPS